MRLFVTDGNLRSTLAVVRGLGQQGISATVGAETAGSLAGSSRYCRETVRYPSPMEQPRRFQEFLCQEMARRPGMLLPMSDVTMRLAAEVAPELMALGTRWPFPSLESIELAQDKRHVLKVASGLGMACPRELLPEASAVEDVAPTLRYPVVIKPRFSRYLHCDTWVQGSVQYADNPAELIALYRTCHSRIPNPLVQEWVEGVGCGVFVLRWDGQLKAAFSHRRLREKPASGGVSVLCESAPLDECLVGDCIHLLSALRWQGPAMVEFKLDRSARPVLMEVNGRFWGSLQLALDAGVNFPAMLYRLAVGETLPSCSDYRIGVRSRWLLGDLDRLLLRLLGRKATGRQVANGSRVQACREFLDFSATSGRLENPRWDDLRPFWFECGSYLRKRTLSLGRSRPAPTTGTEQIADYASQAPSLEVPIARN